MNLDPIRQRIREIDEQINQLLKSGKKEVLIRLEWEALARERYILFEQLAMIYAKTFANI